MMHYATAALVLFSALGAHGNVLGPRNAAATTYTAVFGGTPSTPNRWYDGPYRIALDGATNFGLTGGGQALYWMQLSNEAVCAAGSVPTNIWPIACTMKYVAGTQTSTTNVNFYGCGANPLLQSSTTNVQPTTTFQAMSCATGTTTQGCPAGASTCNGWVATAHN